METNEYSTSSTIQEEPSSPIAYEDTLIGRDNHSNEVKSEEVDEGNDVSVPCQTNALCLREEIKTEELDISTASSEDEGIIHSEWQDFSPMTPKKECLLGQVPHTINSKNIAALEIPQFFPRGVLQNPLLQGTSKGTDLFIKLPPKNLDSGEVLPNKLYRESFVQLGERIDKFQRKIKIVQHSSTPSSNDECSIMLKGEKNHCETSTSCRSYKSYEPTAKSSDEQSESLNFTKSSNCDQHLSRHLRGISSLNDCLKKFPTSKQSYKTEKNFELFMSNTNIRQEDKIKTSVKTLTGNNSYTCDYCMKSFSWKSRLELHLRTHADEKSFSCNHCTKSFRFKSDLNRHLLVHTGEKPFLCKHCTKSFCRKSSLIRHLRVHTGEKPYSCEHCTKSFSEKSNLIKHFIVHTGEKPFLCKYCANAFRHKSNLNQHLLVHTGEKPYSGEHCTKSFCRKSSLNGHLRVHTGEKPFLCKYCANTLGHKSLLNRHLKVHTGEKPFLCKHCTKSFCRRFSLNRHLRVHTGEKPYSCEHCTKSFSEKSNLIKHLIVHTGEKPFLCKHCTKSFCQKSSLNRHLRVHTGEKPYFCDHCTKSFSEKSA